jgi:hypothetical protein
VRATIVESHEHGDASTLKELPNTMALDNLIHKAGALLPRHF